jgi:hypothetical protein
VAMLCTNMPSKRFVAFCLLCLVSFCYEGAVESFSSESVHFQLRKQSSKIQVLQMPTMNTNSIIVGSSLSLSLSSSSAQETETVDTASDDKDDDNDNEETTENNSETTDLDDDDDLQTDLLSASILQNDYFGSNSNGYSMTSGYGRFLYTKEDKSTPRWLDRIYKRRNKFKFDMDEDGYGDMQQRPRSLLQKVVRLPFKVAKKAFSKDTKEPGTLILVRHGESEWNRNKTFTGWSDPGE